MLVARSAVEETERSAVVRVVDAELDGERVDVEWRDGLITDIASHRPTSRRRVAATPDVVVDAAGGAVIPGLHDHHLHLLSLAAARSSVSAGPPQVGTAAELKSAIERGMTSSERWIRAVGYHESVAGDLDGAALDRLLGEGFCRPVRVQHRSGQLWVLNGTAMAETAIGGFDHPGVERVADGSPTGRLFGLDAELRRRIPASPPDLDAVGAELASYGVTSVTDLTPTESASEVDLIAATVLAPAFPVRVHITGGPGLDRSAGAGLGRGPVKLLPPDHQLPDLDDLAAGIAEGHRAGRPVAIHCVSRVGLILALAAWRAAGVVRGDRVEHGAVIPDELLGTIAELGLVVVTQPNFVAERGDRYLAEVDPDDLCGLWRAASLTRHGIAIAGGTDAPFGHPDPWRAIDAAVRRMTSSGRRLGRDERLSPERALDLFLGGPQQPAVPRQVRPGVLTDLCVLGAPLRAALRAPAQARVIATVGRAGVTVT